MTWWLYLDRICTREENQASVRGVPRLSGLSSALIELKNLSDSSLPLGFAPTSLPASCVCLPFGILRQTVLVQEKVTHSCKHKTYEAGFFA